MTDIGAELMKKVALDDQEAFKELIEHYEGMAFALLGRLLNSKEFAEDVAQEAFLRVWNNRQRYRAESKFSTYFYRILYNLALNKIRDNKRKQLFQFPVDESGEAIDLFDGKSLEPGESLNRKSWNILISNALGRLSENQRAALVFQHYDGLALEDIAQIMNQSVSATKSLLHRARANLREALEPYKEQEND